MLSQGSLALLCSKTLIKTAFFPKAWYRHSSVCISPQSMLRWQPTLLASRRRRECYPKPEPTQPGALWERPVGKTAAAMSLCVAQGLADEGQARACAVSHFVNLPAAVTREDSPATLPGFTPEVGFLRKLTTPSRHFMGLRIHPAILRKLPQECRSSRQLCWPIEGNPRKLGQLGGVPEAKPHQHQEGLVLGRVRLRTGAR